MSVSLFMIATAPMFLLLREIHALKDWHLPTLLVGLKPCMP